MTEGVDPRLRRRRVQVVVGVDLVAGQPDVGFAEPRAVDGEYLGDAGGQDVVEWSADEGGLLRTAVRDDSEFCVGAARGDGGVVQADPGFDAPCS